MSDDATSQFHTRLGQKLKFHSRGVLLSIVPKIMHIKLVFFIQNDGYYRAGITQETLSFASRFNCTMVGRASDSMKDPV